jgi:hypothetical protein
MCQIETADERKVCSLQLAATIIDVNPELIAQQGGNQAGTYSTTGQLSLLPSPHPHAVCRPLSTPYASTA